MPSMRTLNALFLCRRAKLHPQKQRSKYICKPEAVVEAGNHFVWEFITGRGSLNVPADAGILHHYRVIPGSQRKSRRKECNLIQRFRCASSGETTA